nr:MAG TPA: hypothetical protein [Caudoviricetes sp.]
MTKPINKDFAVQIAKDVAHLEINVDELIKHKLGRALKITVPRKPAKYAGYAVSASLELPEGWRNMMCMKFANDDGAPEFVRTTDTLHEEADEYHESVYYLVPLFSLSAMVDKAVSGVMDFNKSHLADIDAAIEKAEHEKQKENNTNDEELTYKYLAKYLTDNYLELVRERTRNRELEAQGIAAYVNKNGLKALLETPFEKNTTDAVRDIVVGDYADAKAAMLAEKAKIDAGEVDLSTAQDFAIVQYVYKDDHL